MLRDNLIALRRLKGLTQEELAEKLSVTRQTISKWETGESAPDLVKAKQLAEVFGVSLDELVSFDGAGLGISVPPPRGKYAFGMVKVGDKGQIVIPVKARQVFNIQPGDNLIVLGDEGQGLALLLEKHFLQMLEQTRFAS